MALSWSRWPPERLALACFQMVALLLPRSAAWTQRVTANQNPLIPDAQEAITFQGVPECFGTKLCRAKREIITPCSLSWPAYQPTGLPTVFIERP